MYLGYVSIISQSHIICTTSSHSNRLCVSVKCWDTWVLFGPAFTLYPVFQWYLQNKEILLNLSMKSWNSAFNAQGSRVIISSSCTGRSSENICSSCLLRRAQDKGKTGWSSVDLFCSVFRGTFISHNFPRQFSLQKTGRLYENCKACRCASIGFIAFHKDREAIIHSKV